MAMGDSITNQFLENHINSGRPNVSLNSASTIFDDRFQCPAGSSINGLVEPNSKMINDQYKVSNGSLHKREEVPTKSSPSSTPHPSRSSSTSPVADTHSEKIGSMLTDFWNSMKYGFSYDNWRTSILKTNFSKSEPIWLLGSMYHHKQFQTQPKQALELFLEDFSSRLWFTYRKGFAPLIGSKEGSPITSDSGWGCMLRSGQMMLAQAMICHLLGRHWRYHSCSSEGTDHIHRKVCRWFVDSPLAPFSVHSMVKNGARYTDNRAGDWYGPSTVAHILKESVEVAGKNDLVIRDISVYVAQDCTIYLQDVLNMCLAQGNNSLDHTTTATSPATKWRPLVLLVPVRLGCDRINVNYIPCLKAMLAYRHCVGIMGGKPKHSLYFIGYQDDKAIYLDPHYLQDCVEELREFSFETFHCTSPRKLSFSRMDPSCTIGFYFKTRQDFDDFLGNLEQLTVPKTSNQDYPVFVVSEDCKDRESDQGSEVESERILRVSRRITQADGSVVTKSDEFVLL